MKSKMSKVVSAIGGLMVFAVAGTAMGDWGANFSIHSGADAKFCLDVKGDAKGAGTPVQVWTCHKGENQRWAFSRGTDDWGTIVGTGGLCLALHDNGKSAYSYGCTGADNQKFKQDSTGRITHKESGKCLSLPSVSDGALLEVAACDATPKQTWKFQKE